MEEYRGVMWVQVINVYDPVYESAGAFWPHVHGRIIASLLLEHLTLIGLFLAKGPISFVHTNSGGSIKSKILRYVGESCSSTPFMIALPIITILFHNYCKKRFEPAFKIYPLEVHIYIASSPIFFSIQQQKENNALCCIFMPCLMRASRFLFKEIIFKLSNTMNMSVALEIH